MRAFRALALRRLVETPEEHWYRVLPGERTEEVWVLAGNWIEALGHALASMCEEPSPVALERIDLADGTVMVRLLGTGRSFCVQRTDAPIESFDDQERGPEPPSGLWELLG